MDVLAGRLAWRAKARLSAAEARRVVLAAQGFAERRVEIEPALRHIRRVADRLGAVQIDSVNVLVRSHYLPFFSRLGPYPTLQLDSCAYAGRRRSLFEYWGHEASLLPVGLQPLFRWRMERARRGEGIYGGLARLGRERADYVEKVLAELTEHGPLGVSELTDRGRRAGPWWGWSEGKAALEWLFWAGHVTTARRRGFERVYDLTERALPKAVMEAPTPSPEEAQRALVRIAAQALGVATERDLRDYFRLDVQDARARIGELIEAGALVPVDVEGWAQPAYLDVEARFPRRIETSALISPFDSLVWERSRTERLFGFRLRLEIYTPAGKREHGYYVLPFLLDDRLVARVDLKADRKARRLRVLAAHAEAGIESLHVREPLLQELGRLASWLDLESIEVGDRGTLARDLR